jgi:hypothetical protein
VVIVALYPGFLLTLAGHGRVQVLLVDRAPCGEHRIEVLDTVDLVEGTSEDLVGALRAGDTLNMVGPPYDAAVCALLHPAGPVGHAGLMVVRVRAFRQRLG